MSQITEEIQSAINSLNLNALVKRVDASIEEELFYDLLNTFVEGGDRRWWWEAFKAPSDFFCPESGYEALTSLVPDIYEKVWFVVEDDQLSYYPIYEATTDQVVKIVGECFSYEYYLIPKDKRWLLCETHHNSIVGIGKEVIRKIEQAKI